MFTASVLAHDNAEVHPALTTSARDLLETSFGDQYQEVTRFFFELIDNCNDIREGSIKEDNTLDVITNCGVTPLSWLEHAYNPINGLGWSAGTGTALNKAITEYQEAIDEYSAGNKERAYFQLGRVAHLLEDMTSPSHVHSDVHVAGDDFEEWSEDTYALYAFGTQVAQPAYLTLTDFFIELSLQTYYASSFQGVLHRSADEPVDPACELAQMFPEQIRYIFVGLYGYNYWVINNVGEYEAELAFDDWWQCEDDSGYFYIENVIGVDNNGLFPQQIRSDMTDRDASLMNNTKALTVIWAETLFPLTINYTAGLFKYFYDNFGDCSGVNITHTLYPGGTTVQPGEVLYFTVEEVNNS